MGIGEEGSTWPSTRQKARRAEAHVRHHCASPGAQTAPIGAWEGIQGRLGGLARRSTRKKKERRTWCEGEETGRIKTTKHTCFDVDVRNLLEGFNEGEVAAFDRA